jgi:hypothetical protein
MHLCFYIHKAHAFTALTSRLEELFAVLTNLVTYFRVFDFVFLFHVSYFR